MTNDWKRIASRRWPRSARDGKIHGDGRYAVVICAYFHTSARHFVPSEIYLFPALEQAQEYKAAVDSEPDSYRTVGGFSVYCHASTRELCGHDHELVDLLPVGMRMGIAYDEGKNISLKKVPF